MKAATVSLGLMLGISLVLATFVLPVKAADASDAPLLVLPAPSSAEINLAESQTRPWRFAVDVPVSIDPWVDGVWLDQGSERVWQLRIHSAGAESLSFHFDRWQVPDGAALWVKDGKGNHVQGPYDASHNFRGELWSGMTLGDEAVLELRVPSGSPVPEIHIDTAYHGFRGAQGQSLRKSGNCNIDVGCPEAEGFRDAVDATVLLVIEGSGACTGSLINNTSNDRRPLVLTANHCGIRRGNAQSVVTYFNFQRRLDQCSRFAQSQRESVEPDPQQSLPGATLLASRLESDFSLIELDGQGGRGTIPDSFNPYWIGWTRDETPPENGVTIHHPSGDAKSVTPFTEALEPVSVRDGGVIVETWRVFWAPRSGGRNGGTTEPGSSGSGIFGEDGLLRGQLYGGEASCSNQQAPDFYGRFAVSWDSGSAVNECLRPYLDPRDASPISLTGMSHDGESGEMSGVGTPGNFDQCQQDAVEPSSGSSGSGSPGWWMLAGLMLLGLRRVA